jgi:hypothetical protein
MEEAHAADLDQETFVGDVVDLRCIFRRSRGRKQQNESSNEPQC